mgnify:CR=1 FL=1
MTDRSQLGPEQREAAWTRLAEQEFDVLVIGGGVTGAGVALDAATRGLRTGLVEARDYASGTSSRSNKLFHGGLRYLEQLDFGLVREALRERGIDHVPSHQLGEAGRNVVDLDLLEHEVAREVHRTAQRHRRGLGVVLGEGGAQLAQLAAELLVTS